MLGSSWSNGRPRGPSLLGSGAPETFPSPSSEGSRQRGESREDSPRLGQPDTATSTVEADSGSVRGGRTSTARTSSSFTATSSPYPSTARIASEISTVSQESRASADHNAVLHNFVVAVEASFARCGGCWVVTAVCAVISAVWAVLHAEFVFLANQDDACVQPLGPLLSTLCVISALHLFERVIIRICLCYNLDRDGPDEPLRVRLFRRSFFVPLIVWPFAAFFILAQQRQCGEELQTAIRGILIVYAAALVIIFVLPVVFILIMFSLVRRGYVRAPGAAPDMLIDSLPEVPYDPAVFDDDLVDGHPTTCPICLDLFDGTTSITQTPCNRAQGRGHAFHKECLRNWLKTSRSCPLCRADLVQANDDQVELAESVS